MPRVRFESTTPVSERVKTVNALDRATTMIAVPQLGYENFIPNPLQFIIYLIN
jgi:hypothetical protein